MAVHKHAELIHAWADGAKIQGRAPGTQEWRDYSEPAFVEDFEYRIKPVEPARVYPETAMTDEEIEAEKELLYARITSLQQDRRDLINVGLRHACDNGQVVTREEFDRVAEECKKATKTLVAAGYTDEGGELWRPPLGNAIGDRGKRDMAVAKAVLTNIDAWLVQSYKRNFWPASIVGVDLAAIIAEVK